MKPKPIAVVTGGAGFIGSHMVDLLANEGYSVRIVDNLVGGREDNLALHRNNPDIVFEQTDIRNLKPGSSLFKDSQFVFHFAGIGDIVPSIENPIEYMSTNVLGTVQVLECARAGAVKKLVYAASSSCYGLAGVPTKEDHKIQPQYPYALSKYQGEQVCFHWAQVYDLPINSIRIFNAFGTRSRTSGAYGAVFGVFLRQKLAGKPFTVVGDGTQTRDFLYVTDVVNAFFKAATTNLNRKVWNLGAGRPQSVNYLVQLLGGEVVYIPKRPGEPDCTFADISRIREDLGWTPEIPFEEGVKRILENIDYWKEAPLWDPSSIAKATETWFKFLDNSQTI